MLVKDFRILKATLFSEAELKAQVADLIGKELSFDDLQRAASRLVEFYKLHGYVARVFFPAQEIKDGVVEVVILEGKVGAIRIEGEGKRLDKARVQQFIENRQAIGAPVQMDRISSAIAILNEQPGLSAKSSLKSGTKEGTTDLVVIAEEKPLSGFSLQVDNHGSKGTGELQAGGNASLVNPSGHFDLGVLTFNKSEGTEYLRGDYALAIGNNGLRAGANASHLSYRLTQDALAALAGHGHADTLGLAAQYPLLRSDTLNLSLTANIDEKAMQDYTAAGETANKRVTVGNLGLTGMTSDEFHGGGNTGFGLNLVSGRLDLGRNADSLAADQASRRSEGSYSKLMFNLSRHQTVTRQISADASLVGQYAGKNLDSSERFTLGGPTGIRAYPIGEATGDSGWLAKCSAGYAFTQQLSGSVFLETGHIQLNQQKWNNWNAANTGLPNQYELTGAGLGLEWQTKSFLLSAVLASPLGSNPGRDSNGNDADGHHSKGRGWISISAQF